MVVNHAIIFLFCNTFPMYRTRHFLESALFALIVFLGAMTAILMIRWSPLWSQEAAGWAQAIGSVIAILVAIWISRFQERQRYADALTTASVVAATMPHSITQTLNTLRAMAEIFDHGSRIDLDPRTFSIQHELLVQYQFWSTDDIARLAPMPDNSAYKMAAAIDYIHTAKQLMVKAAAQQNINNIMRMAYAGSISRALDNAATSLQTAANNMHAYTSRFTGPLN